MIISLQRLYSISLFFKEKVGRNYCLILGKIIRENTKKSLYSNELSYLSKVSDETFSESKASFFKYSV